MAKMRSPSFSFPTAAERGACPFGAAHVAPPLSCRGRNPPHPPLGAPVRAAASTARTRRALALLHFVRRWTRVDEPLSNLCARVGLSHPPVLMLDYSVASSQSLPPPPGANATELIKRSNPPSLGDQTFGGRLVALPVRGEQPEGGQRAAVGGLLEDLSGGAPFLSDLDCGFSYFPAGQ
jgi:hypothetical protein